MVSLSGILSTQWDFIKGMQNWYLWYLVRLGLVKNSTCLIYVLRDKTKLNVRATLGDGFAVWVAFLRKLYTPSNFVLSKNDVVVDIGAHIGAFSVFAGQRAAKVISYEPIPENYELARSNILLNHLKNVKLLPLGVAGDEGTHTFYVPVGYWDSCNLYNSHGKLAIDVNCVTLPKIINDNNLTLIDFLKMDCEGAEYEILFNTPSVYLRKIRRIALEYHTHEKYVCAQLKKFLEVNGFEVDVASDLDTMYANRNRNDKPSL